MGLNISIIGSKFGVDFFNLTQWPALYRTRYSRHQRRWVGIPSSQLGDYVFRTFNSSTITINAFSNSITVLSENIWIKNTLLYLHSGLFSLDSALVPFLFGSLCLVNVLNRVSCSSDEKRIQWRCYTKKNKKMTLPCGFRVFLRCPEERILTAIDVFEPTSQSA